MDDHGSTSAEAVYTVHVDANDYDEAMATYRRMVASYPDCAVALTDDVAGMTLVVPE